MCSVVGRKVEGMRLICLMVEFPPLAPTFFLEDHFPCLDFKAYIIT
jgi:hypothetical protein